MRKEFLKLSGIILLLLGVVGIAAWDLFLSQATPQFDGERTINIWPDTPFPEVVAGLEDAGILEKRRGFEWLATWTGWDEQIKAGHYVFEAGLSNAELIDHLRRGLQTPIRVRIPAGTRKDRVIESVASDMAFTAEDLTAVLADSTIADELNTDPDHLWAYMLPDTYFFYWLTPAENVVRRIKGEADSVIGSSESPPQNAFAMSADEVIRMAGIIEWETAHVPEKATVSGVYHNRLRSRWALQADPTVQFAVLEREGSKRRLLFKDYEIQHAYNTYLYRGLPPGPITNPSASSIRAAMHPEDHRYYYFVATGDGTHIFSTTLAEHRRNAQEYYRVMRARRAEQATASGS